MSDERTPSADASSEHAPTPAEPRLFTVIRNADESGVSGTGRVLDGIVFHNGQVVVCWRGDLQARKEGSQEKGFSSVAVYPCWEAFKMIHVDAHPSNETEIVFGAEGDLDESVRELALLDRNASGGGSGDDDE